MSMIVCCIYFRFSFKHVLSYLKNRKLVYHERGQVVIKPLFISVGGSTHVVFSVPETANCLNYFVCGVCDRGFTTSNGLASHQRSDGHNSQLRVLIHSLSVSGSILNSAYLFRRVK